MSSEKIRAFNRNVSKNRGEIIKQKTEEKVRQEREFGQKHTPVVYAIKRLFGTTLNAETLVREDEQQEQENFEATLVTAKSNVRAAMLHENDPIYNRGVGTFFENRLLSNTLPSVLVSEDVSGRFMASVLKRFLNKLNTHLGTGHDNIPVLSYPVGGGTEPEAAKILAERIRSQLEKYAGRTVLLCTDQTDTGASVRPYLEAMKINKASLNFYGIASAGVAASSKRDIQLPITFNVRASNVGKWDLGRMPNLRSIVRTSEGLVLDVNEKRPQRLKAIDEIADVMFDAFLERPAVKAYLERGEPLQ